MIRAAPIRMRILLLACAACTAIWSVAASPQERPPQFAQADGAAPAIDVAGTLERGVECWLVRTAQAAIYSIGPALPAGLSGGDRVRLQGALAGASICMQGTPVRVAGVAKEN